MIKTYLDYWTEELNKPDFVNEEGPVGILFALGCIALAISLIIILFAIARWEYELFWIRVTFMSFFLSILFTSIPVILKLK